MKDYTKKPSSKSSEKFAERYIPNRASSNLETGFEKLKDYKLLNYAGELENDSKLFLSLLQNQMFSEKNTPSNNILKYSHSAPDKENSTKIGFSSQDFYSLAPHRRISKTPYKVLDAPSLQDDFYLNLVDWSPSNLLGVGLGSCVYIWDASTSKVQKLCDIGQTDSVTSVTWSPQDPLVTVGTNKGTVLLFDAHESKLLRCFSGHTSRVGAIAWNSRFFSSASRDRHILHRDLRSHRDYFSRLYGHKQEVCGLSWSFDETQLVSGGNDNKVMVWNRHFNSPTAKFGAHKAAVKALAWSPHQHGLLVTGGGTADRTIKFWNTLTNDLLTSVATDSQVCNLMFSKTTTDLVSTHGYSKNEVVVWQNPGMTKRTTLSGHASRVLYLAMSPDGQDIVTGAGDETLRFWRAFPSVQFGNSLINQLQPTFTELR